MYCRSSRSVCAEVGCMQCSPGRCVDWVCTVHRVMLQASVQCGGRDDVNMDVASCVITR